VKPGTKQEIKIEEKILAIKEVDQNGRTVYRSIFNGEPLNVYDEELSILLELILGGYESFENMFLSMDDHDEWVFVLQAVRRDTERQMHLLLDRLEDTIGPLHCVFESNSHRDFPLIDVVHEKDLARKQEEAGQEVEE